MRSASSSSPERSRMPRLRERLDVVGHDRRAALADAPRTDRRPARDRRADPTACSVGVKCVVDVEPARAACATCPTSSFFARLGIRAGSSCRTRHADEHVLPARRSRTPTRSEHALAQPVRDRDRRSGAETTYVGERCSIVTCAARLGELGHERHRRRAAADDDDALARVVDVVGPLLRMDDAAAEALASRRTPACSRAS